MKIYIKVLVLIQSSLSTSSFESCGTSQNFGFEFQEFKN